MFQFHILAGSRAGQVIDCNETPVRIGRGSLVHITLEDPGVWDEHLEIRFDDLEIRAEVIGSALASINGNPFQHTLVRNGDLIQAGGASLRVYLQPARQRGLQLREWATWVAVCGIVVLQLVIIVFLGR